MGADAPLRVGRFIVIGGGETGVFYVRQLRRAVESGRLETDEIVVVDRDADCPVADVVGNLVRLDVATWNDWLFANLERFGAGDQLVPSSSAACRNPAREVRPLRCISMYSSPRWTPYV